MINYIITSIHEYMNHHRPRPDESVIESLADKWLSATQMARGPEVGRRIPRPRRDRGPGCPSTGRETWGSTGCLCFLHGFLHGLKHQTCGLLCGVLT